MGAFVLYMRFSLLTLSNFSWDPLDHTCWYTNDDYRQRLAWQIGTQLFWNGLTVAGEVVAAFTVTVYMLRARVRILARTG